MIKTILNNLHPAINKDPQAIEAFSISGSGTAIIKNDILQLITSSSPAQFNLRSYTLGSLANELNSKGFTASNLQQSNLSAAVLLEGTYSLPVNLTMFTSFLWQLLKPAALAIVDALGSEHQALLEMIMNTSDGTWLDLFGELFGVVREDSEPEQLYAIRVFDLSVAPRVNNVAIQKTLQDLGYTASIVDAQNSSFNVTSQIPANPPQGFIYSTAQLQNVVDQIRPAGIKAIFQSQGSLSDSQRVTDSISVLTTTTALKYGAGRKWGQMVWGY